MTTPHRTVDFTYACGDKITSAGTSDAQSVHYAYDGDLLTSMRHQGILDTEITYAYDANFLPVAMTYAGVTHSLAYDKDGLLIRSGDANLTRYKKNGLPKQISDAAFKRTRSLKYGSAVES